MQQIKAKMNTSHLLALYPFRQVQHSLKEILFTICLVFVNSLESYGFFSQSITFSRAIPREPFTKTIEFEEVPDFKVLRICS